MTLIRCSTCLPNKTLSCPCSNIPLTITLKADDQLVNLLTKFEACFSNKPDAQNAQVTKENKTEQPQENLNDSVHMCIKKEEESVQDQKFNKEAEREINELKEKLRDAELDTENQMWECQFERGLRLALSNELTKAHEQLKTFQEVKAKNKTMDYELRTTKFKLGMAKNEIDTLNRKLKASMEKIFRLELKLSDSEKRGNRTSTPLVHNPDDFEYDYDTAIEIDSHTDRMEEVD